MPVAQYVQLESQDDRVCDLTGMHAGTSPSNSHNLYVATLFSMEAVPATQRLEDGACSIWQIDSLMAKSLSVETRLRVSTCGSSYRPARIAA
jgi:hypothetical protein